MTTQSGRLDGSVCPEATGRRLASYRVRFYPEDVFERFGEDGRRVVLLAQEEARLLQHHYIGTEHVLLGLLHEGHGVAAQALEAEGVSLEAARDQTQDLVEPKPQSPAGHIPFTPRAKSVLEASLREALQLGHNYIGTEHILLGIVRVGDSVATQVLVALGVDFTQLRQRVTDLVARLSPEPARVHVMSGPLATNVARGHCALCGRDLWEVDRYVSATTAAVCDQCIADAQRALQEAPAAVAASRDIPMPPRVFGPAPNDPAEAREIEHAFRTIFGDPPAPPPTPTPTLL